MWLVLLGFHLVGFVGFNLLLRRSMLNKIDRFTLATLAQTGISLPAVVLLIVKPPHFGSFSAADFAYLAAAVGLTIALQITNVKVLQYLEASVFSVLYNLRLILTTVLGILFLHEAVVRLRIFGGLLVLLGIVIVRQKSRRSVRLQGIIWALMATLAISFLQLFEKLLIKDVGFFNYFPILEVITGVLMWAYLLQTTRNFDYRLLRQPKMVQLMVLRSLSSYGFSGALAAGALLSVANYISSMSVIFIVLLGAIWLGERDYLRRKILATVVAVGGLSLILISGV